MYWLRHLARYAIGVFGLPHRPFSKAVQFPLMLLLAAATIAGCGYDGHLGPAKASISAHARMPAPYNASFYARHPDAAVCGAGCAPRVVSPDFVARQMAGVSYRRPSTVIPAPTDSPRPVPTPPRCGPCGCTSGAQLCFGTDD